MDYHLWKIKLMTYIFCTMKQIKRTQNFIVLKRFLTHDQVKITRNANVWFKMFTRLKTIHNEHENQ